MGDYVSRISIFKVPSVVRCRVYNSSPVFSNHDLGWETRFRQYQKQITRVQCARVRLPIQSMLFCLCVCDL